MFLYITYISASADKLLDAITSEQFQRALLACLASGVAADVAVCATMTIGLIKRRTGFAHTDQLVDRVITYTVGGSYRDENTVVRMLTLLQGVASCRWLWQSPSSSRIA